MPKKRPKGKRGRPKGSLNRSTLGLIAVLDDLGFDAIEQFIGCVSQIEDPNDRATQIAKLFPYQYPRLANIQVEQKTDAQREIENLTPQQLEAKVRGMLGVSPQSNEGKNHEAEKTEDSYET